MMPRRIAALMAVCLLASIAGPAKADNGVPTDRQIEDFLIDIPAVQGIGDDLRRLNEEAHYPGTVGDKDMAYWMRDRLESYGFNAAVETVYAPVPILKRAVLQLLEKPTVDFDLKEAPLADDPAGRRDDAGVPFNAWSGSGDVTAPLVYVNRGLDEDYDVLAKAGVNVQGAIALVRYGAQFRGELARRAAERGAAGVILYSDPASYDGASNGPPYPNGPFRPLGSVQRGSLQSPAVSVPVMPVSALTARRLLQSIHGQRSPKSWRGGLDSEYELGTSEVPVHMRVDQSYSWVTLWNTIGILPGNDNLHHIVMGGHRDAWVYGVTDNGSGISTLMEAARALGYVYKAGWRPQYSIVIAGWDGEEVGELGSNSYVRTHYSELRRGCIAYVNADETATGPYFGVSGAAALSGVLPPLTRLIPYPHDRTETVWDKWRSQPGGVVTNSPGGGSDHDAFLYLLGIPVLEDAFEGPFGVYHSVYDDLRYVETQADPHLGYHRALAQMLALQAFHMTRGPVPYRFDAYVAPMRSALASLAARSGAGPDFTPISQALDRFAARAEQADGQGVALDRAIESVQRLNVIFYGHRDYQAIAFPQLAEALAKGDAAAVNKAVSDVAGGIDAVLP